MEIALNATPLPEFALRQEYVNKNKPLLEIARENREVKREQRRENWKNFVNGVREFGKGLGRAAEMGKDVVELGMMTLSNQEIRDRVVGNASDLLTAVKDEFNHTSVEIGKKFNEVCNDTSRALKQGGEALVKGGVEVVKTVAVGMGREVVAPVIDAVIVPVVQAMEEADELSAKIGAGVSDIFARSKETKANVILSFLHNPSVGFMYEVSEMAKSSIEKRSFLHKVAEKVGGWIERQVKRYITLTESADKMRDDADRLRAWYKNRQKLSTSLGGAAQQLRTIV